MTFSRESAAAVAARRAAWDRLWTELLMGSRAHPVLPAVTSGEGPTPALESDSDSDDPGAQMLSETTQTNPAGRGRCRLQTEGRSG